MDGTKDKKRAPGKDTSRYRPAADPLVTLRPQLFDIAPLSQASDDRFEQEFLESVLGRDPCNEEALMALGHAYTRIGEYEKGLAIDRRLARLRPSDPMVHYNLACSFSLLGRLDDAFAALDRAVSLGYGDATHLTKDPDLAKVRQDPRFRKLMSKIVGRSPRNS